MKKITGFSLVFSLFIFHFSFTCVAQYQYTVLHNFNYTQGEYPAGPLTRLGNSLYGMTLGGGAHGGGCIYSVDTTGNNFKDLLDFNGSSSPQGVSPYGSLLLVGNKFFGMTESGGTNYEGCIFSVNTDGTGYKDLIDFNGVSAPKGCYPFGSLIISGSTLYGMAYGCAGHGYGCIFSVDTSGSSYTDLFDFNGTTTGYRPYGALVMSGNELFGMTWGGGISGIGLIFSIHTDGTSFKDLLNFNGGGNGNYPYGSLILSGKELYGMTFGGGPNYNGVVFSMDTLGNGFKNLHNFGAFYADGKYPLYSQLALSGGNLVGMTEEGGMNGDGTIFSIDTNGTAYSKLYDFTKPTGMLPYSGLLLSGGWMYGTAEKGGTKDSGVVFGFRTCSLNASITINNPILCCNDSNGSVTVTASSGNAPYTYSWSTNPVQTNAQASNLKAGTYSVTVYDNTGCMNTQYITLTQPACLQDSVLGSPSLGCNCHGTIEVFAYGGTQPYTYLWSTGGTYDTVHNLKAGEYYVQVCDNHGCCIKDSFGVGLGDPVTLVQTPISCHGKCDGTASVITWGWNGYLWAPGGQTTATVTGLCAGSYTVTVTNLDTACSAQYVFTFVDPPPLNVSVTLVHNVPCYGYSDGSASASASGGISPYTYQWSDGESTATASLLPAGTASVMVTDNHGCTGSATILITQPTALNATIQTYQNNCSFNVGFNATVTGGTPPYTYIWPNPVFATGNSASLYISCPLFLYSPFNVTITDANGCVTYAIAGFYTPPEVYYGTPTNVSCYGGNNGSATVNICGMNVTTYQYTISPGGTYSSNSLSYTFNNLSAGTYTITVTDPTYNCSSYPYTITITQPASPISVTTTVTPTGCSSTGTATASPSNGISPYTFLWSGSHGSNATATGLSAGTYTVTVTDNNGCTQTATATVTSSSSLTVSASVMQNVSCNGGGNGSASSSASGGATPYTYSWSPSGGSNATATNLSAGTYTVHVTDNAGCTGSATVVITAPAAFYASIYSSSTCTTNPTLETTITGGKTPYTYSWSDGSTNSSALANLLACVNATYTLTVKDNNGCTATASILITAPVEWNGVTQTNVTCNGGNNGSITMDVCGGSNSGYAYYWNSSSTYTSVQSYTATNLSAGTYSVYVWDYVQGCTTTTLLITITQPVQISVTTTVTPTGCSSTGTATASPSNGISPYTFLWSGSHGSNATATGLSAGTYTVTVTDNSGCTQTATATVTSSSSLTVSASVMQNVSCNGGSNGSASSTVSGGATPYTYSWSGGGTNSTKTGLSAGTYTLTVMDNSGCTATASVVITAPAAFNAYISNQFTCSTSPTLWATVSGGKAPYTYLWSDASTSSSETVNLISCLFATYSVTITDNNGCTATASIYLTGPVEWYGAVAQTNVMCYGGNNGTITMTVCGGSNLGYVYHWNSSSAYSSFQTYTATNLSAGTYTVYVSDYSQPCSTNSMVIYITQPNQLVVSATATSNASCNANGSASSTVSGGNAPYTYSWSGGGGTNSTATGLSAGNYTVTVTDSNGCTNSATAIITNLSGLAVTASVTQNISCYGNCAGVATSTVSGGAVPYTYTWSGGGGTNPSAGGLCAGTYTLTVTDNAGCINIATTTITQPNQLNISANVISNVTCNGVSDGSAAAAVSGGTSPYTYLWSDAASQTTINATALSAGTYTVTVTDNNGCSGSAAALVTQPNTLVVTLASVVNISCYGANNGIITMNITGGTKISNAYLISWTGGITGDPAVNVPPGTYTITATDFNGCTATASATLTQPTQLIATATANPNVSCGGVPNGNATAVVSGGTASYTYLWSDGFSQTTATAYQLGAGTYTVTVTDNHGCTATASAIVTQPAAIIITTDSTNDNGNCNGSAWVTVNGGSNPYTYFWTNGQTTDSITNQCSGNYCCTITDANGCVDSVCITINLSTGTNTIISNNGNIIVYPNPTNGIFSVVLSHPELVSGSQTITIYNVLGEEITVASLKNNEGDYRINLSTRPSGVYFYRVLTQSGKLLGDGKLIIEK